MTHESPINYSIQKQKLSEIKAILDEKSNNNPNYIYQDGLTTTEIIRMMNDFCRKFIYVIPKT